MDWLIENAIAIWAMLAGIIGLTEEQIDDLLRAAALITA